MISLAWTLVGSVRPQFEASGGALGALQGSRLSLSFAGQEVDRVEASTELGATLRWISGLSWPADAWRQGRHVRHV
jgi:hypothetical protein